MGQGKHSKLETTSDYLLEVLSDLWKEGRKRFPTEFREYFTDYLLLRFYGKESRPGTWKKACNAEPILRGDPFTDALHLSKEWAWNRAKSSLKQLSNPALIRYAAKLYPDITYRKYLIFKSQSDESLSRKLDDGAKKGGISKRGYTKESPEKVEKYFNDLRAKHPTHSIERICQLTGKKSRISARTVRKYIEIQNKKL